MMLRYGSQAKLWSLMLIGVGVLTPFLERPATARQLLDGAAVTQLNAQGQQRETRLPRAIARQVQRDLAQRLNVSRRSLTIVSSSRETWPDSCLGVGAANERCATATVEGWRIELTNGQQNWVYRTDLPGRVAKLEPAQQAGLPPDVGDRVLQTVSQEVGVPLVTLRITESQPKTWDGCMGIFVPDQACTMIAISGYRVVVDGAQQSWVYHISEDGSRIVQNPTASGSRGGLVPTFTPLEEPPSPQQTATLVFCMTESGGFAGQVTERFLTSDGVLYRQERRYNPTETAEPVVEKRLSPQQVQQFQQVLLAQRFPNLDRLRYFTDAALADYPTIKLQAMGSTVEYIDLEEANLPPSLQAIIQAWQQL